MDKLNGGNASTSSGLDLFISCITFSRWMPFKLYLCYKILEGRIAINFLSSLNSRVVVSRFQTVNSDHRAI